jgi:cell cycle sensor histidine kinase DivJ
MTDDVRSDPDPPPLAALAHELRTPLSAVVGMADAMRNQALGPLPAAYVEYARLIEETGRHMIDVLGTLVQPEPVRRPVVAVEAARDVIESLRAQAETRGVGLALEAPGPASGALVDHRPFVQVLFNLLDNALKVSKPGGLVLVTVSAAGRMIRLDVADNGGEGQASAPGGSGLGLAIVRALCAAHGGDFKIEIGPAGALATAWLAEAVG